MSINKEAKWRRGKMEESLIKISQNNFSNGASGKKTLGILLENM